jgi:hypothetical protein
MMPTYLHRDRRLARLRAALDSLLPDDPQRPQLTEERDLLSTNRWQVADRTVEFVVRDWLWATRLTLFQQVTDDPLLVALGEQVVLTPEQATAIENLPREPGEPRADFLEDVRALVGDSDAFAELIDAGLRLWLARPLADQQYPFDDVGVFLPVRLETLFEPLGDVGRWQLSLRVVPDEASVCRDNDLVSEAEVAALTAFWAGLDERQRPDIAQSPDAWLTSAAGGIAWERLCQRIGTRRAAWLVPACAPIILDDRFVVVIPPERIGSPSANRVGGVPDELAVWIVIAGQPTQLGVLRPHRDCLTLPLPASEAVMEDHWLVNWDRAVRRLDDDDPNDGVGMAGVFPLPEGATPATITALYVVGLGDESPAAHFRAQVAAGELGVLSLGAPTNTIHGVAAADLGNDQEDWRAITANRLTGQVPPPLVQLSQTLLGDGSVLPALPGGARDDVQESQRLARALWPALWGFHERDFWQQGDAADLLGLWAWDNLWPEGPLPPLRIDDQPYGLLPTTALADWTPMPDDQQFGALELRLARRLLRQRQHWAQAARSRGTNVGATTQQLLDLLGQSGLTAQYDYRPFFPPTLLAQVLGNQQAFLDEADQAYARAGQIMGQRPAQSYLTWGSSTPLMLPLLGARRLPPQRQVRELFEVLVSQPITTINYFLEFCRSVLPDSLLLRLMMLSVLLEQAWYAQAVQGVFVPLINPPDWQDSDPLPLFGHWRNEYLNVAQQPVGGLRQERFERTLNAVFDLAAELDRYLQRDADPLGLHEEVGLLDMPPSRRVTLDRALRATLDTAAQRIDPWITGLAWRRLTRFSRSPQRAYRLGLYGWVDGPFLGEPGPNDAGLLHTPSHAQTLTAIILRDKFRTAQAVAGGGAQAPWAIKLDSVHVRQAVELANEVRLGLHLQEVLGRWVEEVVATRDGVNQLRATFPLQPGKPDPAVTCNGQAALAGLLAGLPGLLLAPEQQARLQQLHDTLDSYADLLVADAVHHVVTGRADHAGELMDAAAGLSRPPTFAFTKTPPSGYQLTTSVLGLFPAVAPPVEETAPPLLIAEPALAAYVLQQCGDPATWVWQRREGEALVPVTTLADLALPVSQIAFLSDDLLRETVSAVTGVTSADLVAPDQHRLLRHLLVAFGTRPATIHDLPGAATASAELRTQLDGLLLADLTERYRLLRQAGATLLQALAEAVDAPGQRAALRQALAWGIIPTAEPTERADLFRALVAGLPPADELLLGRLVTAAMAALTARLAAADAQQARLAEAALQGQPLLADTARAVAELAAPDGRLSILATWAVNDLVAQSTLVTANPDETLDSAWLATITAVRAPLARLEALQLEATELGRFASLTAWTTAPGDPWQTTLIQQNRIARDQGNTLSLQLRPFVAAYGAADAWQGERVAVGLIDLFGEAIPMPQRTTFAAFGFNAPAASAPQAILLAVPPVPRTRLEGDGILAIVQETHELAHARAARAEDLGDLQSLVPSMWFPATGPEKVHLDPSTVWSFS